jgi:hypothetical protein
LKNGTRLLEDMKTAYHAKAKYVIVFNFPHAESFGILKEEYFTAMQTFWDVTRSRHQDSFEKIEVEVVFVLPKDYGWGMQWLEDRIWRPEWGPDNKSQLIWENMNKLMDEYGLRLGIIYDDTRFNFTDKNSEIYYWNSQIS